MTSPDPSDPRTLAGEWHLERRVQDRHGGGHGRLHGRLVVTPDAAGGSWSEHGTLCWAGRRLPAHRALALRLIEGQWWLVFGDGSPLHAWQPGRPVVHHCRADVYTGLVDVDPSGTEMRTLWDVRGPRKEQRLFSRYRRLHPLGTPGAARTGRREPGPPPWQDGPSR